MPNSNHPALFKTKYGYHCDVESRLDVVKKSDWIGGLKEALDHDLQKTVRTAIERRMKKLDADLGASAPHAPSPSPSPDKSRRSRDSAKAELIEPGQISKGLASSLKERGKQLTDKHLATLIAETEQTRADYQSKAILTGIALLAKKSSLPHGKWKVYLEDLFSKNEARFIFGDGAYRQFAVYMQLARRFLWKIETDGFAEEVVETDHQRIPITAEQITSIATSDSESLDPIFDQLYKFVGGRSLRRMLADFRQAEKDADEEERTQGSAGASGTAPGGEGGAGGTPDAPKPLQLMLWESYCRDTAPMLDRLFDKPGTEDLRGEEAIAYYSNIAGELEERAKRARHLADAAKQGSEK